MDDGMSAYRAAQPAISPAVQAAMPAAQMAPAAIEAWEAAPAARPYAPVGSTEWHTMMAEVKRREAMAWRRMAAADATRAVEAERMMREAMAMADWNREMARRAEAAPRAY